MKREIIRGRGAAARGIFGQARYFSRTRSIDRYLERVTFKAGVLIDYKAAEDRRGIGSEIAEKYD